MGHCLQRRFSTTLHKDSKHGPQALQKQFSTSLHMHGPNGTYCLQRQFSTTWHKDSNMTHACMCSWELTHLRKKGLGLHLTLFFRETDSGCPMPALIGSSNFGLVGGCLKGCPMPALIGSSHFGFVGGSRITTIKWVCQCIFPQDPQVQTKLFCKTHVCNACNNHNSKKLSLPFQDFPPQACTRTPSMHGPNGTYCLQRQFSTTLHKNSNMTHACMCSWELTDLRKETWRGRATSHIIFQGNWQWLSHACPDWIFKLWLAIGGCLKGCPMPALIGSSHFGLVGGCLKAMEVTHTHNNNKLSFSMHFPPRPPDPNKTFLQDTCVQCMQQSQQQ